MDRITAIKESLAIFVCGVLSCIPVIGIIPAIYALANWRYVRTHHAGDWNPADHYLRWGVILALVSLVGTLLFATGVAAVVIGRQLS
jgi:ABC-type Fe3+ transport system permease subunit